MTVEVYVMDYGRKYLQLQWTDPHTGKRVTQSSKCTSKQMKQAILKAEEKKKQLNAVDSPQDGSIGWKDFRDRFACQMLSGAAVRTSQTYISILNMLEKFRRPTELRQVNSRFLSEYVGWLRGLPRSETTIQAHMRHIKAVMRWARANRFIPEIPSIPVVTRASKRLAGRPDDTTTVYVAIRNGADTAFNYSGNRTGLTQDTFNAVSIYSTEATGRAGNA